MQLYQGRVLYSATDLNHFLACEHLTALDLGVVSAGTPRPARAEDDLAILARLGDEHEARYLAQLREGNRDIVEIDRNALLEEAAAATIDAMTAGREIIYQAAFLDDAWMGRADFLRRVPNDDGELGAFSWHYEVEDAKLARHTEPYFLLQLAYYSEHVARVTGRDPKVMHVILGDRTVHPFRYAEFAAYYRHVKQSFLDSFRAGEATYPLPVPYCAMCVWKEHCEAQWKADDHLEQVANISRLQISRLNDAAIATLEQLGAAGPQLCPQRMERPTFEKLRRQARLQLAQRQAETAGAPPIEPEFLPHAPEEWAKLGLGLMPQPSPHDVFFDMEGDPYYDLESSLEYLFGFYTLDEGFRAFWGCDRSSAPGSDRLAEKLAFERFIDYIMDRFRRHPQMHVYHYASYEKTKMLELSQRHATREDEVDTILRSDLLVDLYRVVRQSIVVGQPKYSIKNLEIYYQQSRDDVTIKGGGDSVVRFEQWLAGRNDPAIRDDGILDELATYNKVDCISTHGLREWLLALRERLMVERAIDLPFFTRAEEPAKEPTADKYEDLKARLRARIPDSFDPESDASPADDVRMIWQALHMLEYHWREDKPVHWLFHDRCATYQEEPSDLLDDSESLVHLRYIDCTPEGGKSKSSIARYRFPTQEFKLDSGVCFAPHHKGEVGEIQAVQPDDEGGLLILKRAPRHMKCDITDALVVRTTVPAGKIRDALAAFAESLLAGTVGGKYRAARDVLARGVPRLTSGMSGRIQPEVADIEGIAPILTSLDDSYLFVQGPPGSGKTYTGARLIAKLLYGGARVGVTANSHKAIHNLLTEVEDVVAKDGRSFAGVKAGNADKPETLFPSAHGFVSNAKGFDDLPDAKLFAGTAWAICGSKALAERPVDYLFVDEAGQVALPHAIAMSTMARNVVLLGDPLQLSQVSHTSHPGGIGRSVLLHLLGDELRPVGEDRGVLLTESYRMNAPVCAFISAMMYEDRLSPAPGRALQRVDGPGLSGQGLRHVPVLHDGNRQSSLEEAERIADEALKLLGGTVTDHHGKSRALMPSDIMVVTPYNAQVRTLASALRLRRGGCEHIEVGTVDKFQGREAHVVFFSTAASTVEDAPRGIGFIFDRNRFNVAISRARSLAVLVGSPALLTAACSTVDQARAMNAVLSFVERTLEGRVVI